MYARLEILSIFLLVIPFTATAQKQDCVHRTMPVALRDNENLPLQNISVTDLLGKIHGKPVKFLSLAPDQRAHRLVIILDASGSMGNFDGEPSNWTTELKLAHHFFETNRGRSEIAMVIFNTQVIDVTEFSEGNGGVGEKLQLIGSDESYIKKNVRGRTALYDAILQGLRMLSHPTSADALYVLTDGGDNASKHRGSEVTERLAVTSVRLFAVIIERGARGYQRIPEQAFGLPEISDLALKSGGEILSAAEAHGAAIALTADREAKFRTEETLSRLYQVIVHDQLVEIELPFPIKKNENWELKLSEDARHRLKNIQITYPVVLTGCDAEVSGSDLR
jgi:hypothetical protein